MSSILCEKADDFMLGFLTESLGAEEQEIFAEHLQQCPSCSAMLEKRRMLQSDLRKKITAFYG
jgi:predicted anti-sigma-YlaC factor YlaD